MIAHSQYAKLTMQQAILQLFPDVQATYRFTNRNDNIVFSHKCFQSLRASVARQPIPPIISHTHPFTHPFTSLCQPHPLSFRTSLAANSMSLVLQRLP